MLTKSKHENRIQMQIISIEDLVPEDHILRAIDKSIDFDFIYKKVEHLYCLETGRPSIDPVVLFKIALIQYMFGIRSMRQIIKEIQVNMAYRWFLGYGMTEKTPHFTTFGKNYERRFADSTIFEQIFEQILQEAMLCGFIDTQAIFRDSPRVKVSVSKKKDAIELVKIEAKYYHEKLMKELNVNIGAKKTLEN